MDNIDSERTDSWMDKLTAGRQAGMLTHTCKHPGIVTDRQTDIQQRSH